MRNLATGTSRALGLAVVFVVLVGGLAAADARVLVGIWRDADDFRDAGASVRTLASEQGKVMDGTRCQGLGDAPGIGTAGALRPGEPITVANLPSSDLTVWEVTPGVLGVLDVAARADGGGPDASSGGLWLSDDLAAVLGVRAGDELITENGLAQVGGVYFWPDDGRDRVLGYAIVAPVPALGTFEQCWADVWPTDSDATGLLYSAAAPDAADLRLAQLNATRGTTFDLPGRVVARATAVAPAAAAVVGLVLGYLAVRARRLELASALHAGVLKPHLAWQHLLEAGAWLANAMVVCAAITGVAALVGSLGPFGVTWATAAVTVGTGSVSVLVGTVVGVLATREKHMFRYFKER